MVTTNVLHNFCIASRLIDWLGILIGETKMENMRIHFITGATKNSAEALSMAMQIWSIPYKKRGEIEGVQELIETINATSIKLRNLCISHGYKINDKQPDA